MGFIKKIFGAIFGLIASLLKVVGVGKKSEYFLEIDDSQANPSSNQSQPAENQAQSAKTEEVASSSPAPAAIATDAASQNGSQPSPQPTAQASAQATAEQNEPIAVLTQNGATPQPMPVAAATESNADATFAPEYLNPAKNQTRRRRPGANMGSFMSMAKNVKVSGS